MKILHVIPGVPPRSGGPTNALFGMVRALRAVGVEAEIATTDSDVGGNLSVPLGVKAIHEDAPIYYFRSPTLQKYGFSPELADWLRVHIKEYDLLHIHGIFAHSTLSAAAAARKIGIPYIIRPAGTLDPWPMRKNSLLKRTFLALIGWRILNQAAAIHATSEWEKKALGWLKVSPPLVTVPQGTDPLLETNLPSPGEFRKLYPESEQKKLILWLSRIDPIKGLDSLLTAMKQTKEKRNDFFFVIAGSGAPSYERHIRHRVVELGLGDLVAFCGFLEGRRKKAALWDADLFVLPSFHENFGMAVIEAMSMGVPVLISDQVGIHREVAEYGAGLVIRCDGEDIAQGLQRLLDDEPLRHGMGKNGKRLVQEKFIWPRVGEQLVNLYHLILASNDRSAQRGNSNAG